MHGNSCSGKRPGKLGVCDGLLAPCPKSLNCVSSQATDKKHRIDPLRYTGSRKKAKDNLIQVIRSTKRTKIVEDNHAENVKLLELRFGPTNYVSETFRSHEIVEAVIDGLRRGTRDFGMHTGLIICGIRTDPEATRRAAQIAVNFQGFYRIDKRI